MVENIAEMRARHERDIAELRMSCKHETVSDCMPFQWAPGHISHCVIVCTRCGEEVFTTALATPDSQLFECHRRPDCFLILKLKGGM